MVRSLLFVIVGMILSSGLMTPTHCQAQDDEGTGLWFAYFGNGNMSELGLPGDRLKWWFDGHARFLDDADGFNQSIVRPGVGWAICDDSALWAGYGWIRTSPIAGEDFDEHRIWQQWTWSPTHKEMAFLIRSRFEQRLVETGDDTGLRWRQMFRAQKTLTNCPTITLVGWDEAFFNLNDTDWGANAGFGQNRAFIGFGYKQCRCDRGRVEVGYLNQAINLAGDNNRVNHILSINFFR